MGSVIAIIGMLLAVLSVVMVMPVFLDLQDSRPFLEAAGLTLFIAGSMFLGARPGKYRIGIRQAYLLTSGAWLMLSACAALPFFFHGISLADSFFEAVSGVTTTGSTVLSGLDNMPKPLLLWRALLQWVGGIGIIVTSIAILPMLSVGGMQLFRTESSDQSEKDLPRAATFAGAILVIYVGLSAVCAMCFWLAGMTPFDAITHAMTTLSTGGFSTHDASMGHFTNPAILWLAALFMLAGGLPFTLYIRVFRGKPIRSIQVRVLLSFLAVTIGVLTLWLMMVSDMPLFVALTQVTFNVVSVVTTTGFASTDYLQWGNFAVVVFFFIMFAGSCTGSTSGGLKMMRLIVAYKTMKVQLQRLIQPHGVFVETYDGRNLSDDVSNSVSAYITFFFLSFMLLTFVLQTTGLDFQTSLSGAITALTNVGPGIGDTIGPAGNFATLPDFAKWALSYGMLLGRLEFFTLLVLFTPMYWRK